MGAVDEGRKAFESIGENFDKAIVRALLTGVVSSVHDRWLLLARPLFWTGDRMLDGPPYNTWFIEYFFGHDAFLWGVHQMPYELPYMAFRRDGGKVKIYSTRKLLGRLVGIKNGRRG